MFERSQPKYSIIIPSWFTNEQHGKLGENETYWFAQECLKLLLKRTPYKIDGKLNFELILIDNGSTITTKAFREGMMPVGEYWAKADVLIRNSKNLGYAPACNQGINLARGKYIVVMNNDIIVWSSWLEALMAVFELNLDPPAGVVMPALQKQTKDAHEALAMKEIDLTTNYGKYSPGAEFGSCYMIKKELVDKLIKKDGFFYDEQFLLGFQEDRDLWKRVRELGYDTYRCHETRVWHMGNMSIDKFKNRKKYTTANREKFKKKWNRS